VYYQLHLKYLFLIHLYYDKSLHQKIQKSIGLPLVLEFAFQVLFYEVL